MALRNRHGKWHYRFVLDRREYSGATDLDATKRNQTAASAMEAEHKAAIREGRAHRRNLTARRCSDAIPQYLAWCATEHRDRPSTARRIAVSFASLGRFFGDTMIAAIGAAEIEAYKTWRIADHQVRDVTLRHDLHALSGFFRWAQRMGYATENPVRLIKIPSDRDAVRIHVLTAAEEKAYFAAALADPLLHDIGRVLLAQGMRPDELLSATVGDVDLDAGTFRIARSKSAAGRRTLTLTAESRSVLARRIAAARESKSLWLLPGKKRGTHLTASGLAKKHERICKLAGVEFVPYDCRHTFATRMAQAGCDLATLAAILGHASLRLVQRYIHVSAEHQRAAMLKYEAAQIATEPVETVQ